MDNAAAQLEQGSHGLLVLQINQLESRYSAAYKQSHQKLLWTHPNRLLLFFDLERYVADIGHCHKLYFGI